MHAHREVLVKRGRKRWGETEGDVWLWGALVVVVVWVGDWWRVESVSFGGTGR